MQKAYITALCEIAAADRNVLSLLADSGTGYDELFRRYYPDQLLDFGIAEENMVSAAAGMAMCGKIPFVYTAGAFLGYRSLEFIRDDICLQNLNVKIVGMGSGLSWSTLGATHHTTEDLGILRSLPNLTIFTAACPMDVEKAVKEAYKINGPVYIRIGMNQEPNLYEEDYELVPGKNVMLQEGSDISIFTSGSIAAQVMEAARLLKEQGISAQVTNIISVKPLDEEDILQQAEKFEAMFTVEEHSITGGIGSAVAEVLAEQDTQVRFRRIGLRNCFASGYGTHAEVQTANGLDAQGICSQILAALKK